MAFSPDGRWLSASSLDGSALLWDLNSANPPTNPLVLRKSDSPILALAFSPSGHWLADGGGDNAVWLWDLNAADPSADPVKLSGNLNPVTALAFSPADTTNAVTAGWHPAVRMGVCACGTFKPKTRMPAPRLLGTDPDHPVVALAFSPDSRWLAAASGFTVWLWDMQPSGCRASGPQKPRGPGHHTGFQPGWSMACHRQHG